MVAREVTLLPRHWDWLAAQPGGASAALLIRWLRAMGRPATLYIPDRIDEGYGPNPPAMQALAAAHDLIVCVDCGTLSHAAIAAAAGTARNCSIARSVR